MTKSNIRFFYPDGSFYFSHQERIGYYAMPGNHFHNQYELYYLASGERNYFIKDKVVSVSPGNLVLINKNDLHKTTDAGTNTHTRTVVNFDENFLLPSPHMDELIAELFTINNGVIPFLPCDRQHLESFFNRLHWEIKNKKTGYEISLQLILMELLVYTRRHISKHPPSILTHSTPMHEKVDEIVQYINNNFSQPLSLSSISKLFYISPYYLSRIFKASTGFTFVEYLNSMRIREAQRLLLETSDSIAIIGEKVGCGSASNFGRVFKKITTLSPLAYQKLHKFKNKSL